MAGKPRLAARDTPTQVTGFVVACRRDSTARVRFKIGKRCYEALIRWDVSALRADQVAKRIKQLHHHHVHLVLGWTGCTPCVTSWELADKTDDQGDRHAKKQ